MNVLIALAWPNHVQHAAAHRWFAELNSRGTQWATCPTTQTAFVRISSNPKIIPAAVSPQEALAFLQKMAQHPLHTFFESGLSILEQGDIPAQLLQGYKQITDVYLLLLAQKHNAVLASFDGRFARAAQSSRLSQHIHFLQS
ncbi:MAG: TA system VapC family ribonuclease toxin [bacterium]